MRKILLSFSILSLIFLYQAQTQKAHSNAANPPANMTGQGGASCASGGCHTGGAAGQGTFGVDVIVGVFDSSGSTTNEYMPGEQYEIVVSFLTSFEKYGFAMSSDGSGDEFIGGSNTIVDSSGDQPQIEHSGSNEDGSWTFNWMAPASDEGDITFYFGGLGANGNGNNNGDTGITGTLTLASGAPVEPCASEPTASASATAVCVGETVTMTGTYGAGDAAYEWTVTPSVANVNGDEISFPDTGCALTTYIITMTPSQCDNGTEVTIGDAASVEVQVYPSAEGMVEVLLEGDCTTQIGLADGCDGLLSIDGPSIQTGEAGSSGVHTYSVSSDTGGCPTTVEVAYDCVNTGTEALSTKPLLMAFPQPANEVLNLNLAGLGSEELTLRLIDLNGRVLYQKEIFNSGSTLELNTTELAAGVYLLHLNNAQTAISTKVVVAH